MRGYRPYVARNKSTWRHYELRKPSHRFSRGSQVLVKAHPHSEGAIMRNGLSPASRLNAILHEQPKDFEGFSGIVDERVIERLARQIVQKKGRTKP